MRTRVWLSELCAVAAGGRVPRHQAQRGVVLIITLIALVLLLLAAAAMVRSVDTSAVLSGNLAFRRDLANQGERGLSVARKLLVTGALAAEATRDANQLAQNYSAVKLATNASGVPTILANSTAFSDGTLTMTGADLTQSGVTVRYVIDRLCTAAGAFSDGTCEIVERTSDTSGSSWQRRPGGESRPIYRISVRVTGPRNTQAFYQTTFVL